ncbi:MAG: DUF4832 domain-containing protein [Kiritimatiellae bacterium]|nr:DUF4832 domain-containing protein [Kiritimatiellia bacterium]
MRKISLGFLLLTVCSVRAGAVTVHPSDDGRALINPDMGWTMHYYSNVPHNYGSFLKPADTAAWFPGCSVVYLRLPWAYLEPEEGVFNWTALDTPAQRWIERGGQVAFRITCSESWWEYATPKWVFDAGAKGVRWSCGKGPDEKGNLVDPDFADPVFLAKLENFLKVFARRYDGRPEVAFLDIGTYGLWGEGHTLMSSRLPQEKMNADVKRHIDLHVKYFPRTTLVISDDVSGPQDKSGNYPLLDYARSLGVGWRDDSILVQPPPNSWFHTDQAERYWRTLPVVLEHEHYGASIQRKAWVPELLLKSVEDHHASYMSIHWNPHQEYVENREIIERITRRLGYRLVPREITWPDTVTVGGKGRPFEISWAWANQGVAPCYRGGFPALTVKDAEGAILAVLADEGLNVKDLPVAEAGKAEARGHAARFCLGRWEAPVTSAGSFDVFVSVGTCDGTPVFELPLPGGDGHKRYKIGTIRFVTE